MNETFNERYIYLILSMLYMDELAWKYLNFVPNRQRMACFSGSSGSKTYIPSFPGLFAPNDTNPEHVKMTAFRQLWQRWHMIIFFSIWHGTFSKDHPKCQKMGKWRERATFPDGLQIIIQILTPLHSRYPFKALFRITQCYQDTCCLDRNIENVTITFRRLI